MSSPARATRARHEQTRADTSQTQVDTTQTRALFRHEPIENFQKTAELKLASGHGLRSVVKYSGPIREKLIKNTRKTGKHVKGPCQNIFFAW